MKVTIVIEDKNDDYLSVEVTPSFREIAAKRLSGDKSPALAYAQHIGNFLKMSLGKEKKEESNLITP